MSLLDAITKLFKKNNTLSHNSHSTNDAVVGSIAAVKYYVQSEHPPQLFQSYHTDDQCDAVIYFDHAHGRWRLNVLGHGDVGPQGEGRGIVMAGKSRSVAEVASLITEASATRRFDSVHLIACSAGRSLEGGASFAEDLAMNLGDQWVEAYDTPVKFIAPQGVWKFLNNPKRAPRRKESWTVGLSQPDVLSDGGRLGRLVRFEGRHAGQWATDKPMSLPRAGVIDPCEAALDLL